MKSDDLSAVYADIAFLQAHLYRAPDVAVKRWACVECQDYQIPIALLIGLLTAAVPPISRRSLRLHQQPEHEAVIEIVTRSHLSSVLRYDPTEQTIAYLDTVDASTREAIAQFLASRASVLPD